jgi:hypothetical protein
MSIVEYEYSGYSMSIVEYVSWTVQVILTTRDIASLNHHTTSPHPLLTCIA